MSVIRWQDMNDAPWDEYVLLCVPSGVPATKYDYIQGIRFTNGFHNYEWNNTQLDHLSESHAEPIAWAHILEYQHDY